MNLDQVYDLARSCETPIIGTTRKGIGRPGDRTECPAGHPYDEANTYLVMRVDGSIKQRMCRECGRERLRRRRAAAKEVMPNG